MSKIFNVTVPQNVFDSAMFIARLGIGGMMLIHGIPKIAGLSADPVQFVDFMGLPPTVSLGLAVFAEVVCSILIIIGFATRLATIPLIITMLVALLVVHAEDAFGDQEMVYHYLLGYVLLLLLGSGRYSVDAAIAKKNV